MRHGLFLGIGIAVPLLAVLLAARWLYPPPDLSGLATREELRTLAVEQKSLKERVNAIPFPRPGKGSPR
ncbi:MAG: hypothetical protein L6R30_26405 [Thermoanaerobaculia bacterium]|nr:hypothetical protein [Thermoanaerobaculia bacterium]